ncbi:MAG: alpha-amylase family glycosyl hydrolase [Gracilimonas sp.]|nr:alpha-amylase family glycosyl hydrolase [Gracilimonas sp.]
MSYQIESQQFNASEEFVDVAGSFNGWGETLIQLSDEDLDSVYSVEVDGFSPGQEIAYKFRINGEWNDREEFPGAGNDRLYTVKADSNHIYVWYNDERPPTGPPEADFTTNSTQVFTNSLIQFQNRSAGKIDSVTWFFESGTPEVSNEQNPQVRYSETGSFDVQLLAYGEAENDTLLVENYITVTERETEETKWWNETVFYEIFVRSFYDSDGDGIGDFNGLTEKLDYLNDGDPNTYDDLGISGIWLMPIHESPSYHGYDVINYRSINPDYGTMEDFKNFLDAAHERGIKVIIDYVMNHTSTEHPWFEKSAAGDAHFRDFYRWSETNPGYSGPWGQQVWHQRNGDYYYGLFWGGMPDLNYENPAVEDSMFTISDYWINKIGIDGFRQDAVLYIDEDGPVLKNTEETFQFWQDFNTNLKAANPDAFAVGEAWESTDIAIKYMTEDRLDYVFEFDLAQAILNGVNNETAAPIISQMQKVYDEYPFLQYGTFLTNHDQNRVMNVLGEDVEKAKLAASLYLTLPGIPYIYYGEEIGMLGQKPDPDIRLPMQWSDEANAGFSENQPWRSINSNYTDFNVEVMEENENSLLNHYKKLIHIRNEYSDLSIGEYEAGISSEESLFTFIRQNQYAGSPIMIAVNLSADSIKNASSVFSKSYFEYGPSNAGYYETDVLIGDYKSEEEFRFSFAKNESQQLVQNINLAPYSTKIILVQPVLTSKEFDKTINSFQLHQNYPNPFNPTTTISFYLPSAQTVKLNIFDITGRLVATLVEGKMNAGNHSHSFDAFSLSSGVYFYQLETNSFTSVKKMTLIK